MYSFRPPESNSTLKVKRKSVFDWRTDLPLFLCESTEPSCFSEIDERTARKFTVYLMVSPKLRLMRHTRCHFARSDSLQSLGSFLVSTYCKLRKYFLLLMFSAPLKVVK